MDRRGKIAEYRGKLDKTLASPDLTNDENVQTLVSNQLLDSQLGENRDFVVKKKSKEVSSFLRELRSVSKSDDSGWKVKQDTDEFRVMYREGPEGSPFHTLLCEGFIDGPVDVCLCISCESDLYKKWWPQAAIPTFRVISSHVVKKVRMGEQISLVRMKLSWPLSSREALVHYFVFEYFKDGLVVVLLKSLSDSENIDFTTHGFSRDGIPYAEDIVRIDVFGGFAIQKVSADRSYFRTIANMDIKLDFIPPSLINFIARQLVGSGFKLYKREVSSNSNADGKFREALKDPLYTRIHEALYGSTTDPSLDETRDSFVEQNNNAAVFSANEITECNDSEGNDAGAKEEKAPNKIEVQDSNGFESSYDRGTDNLTSEITEEEVTISRDVRQALGTLEKAINMIREYKSNAATISSAKLRGSNSYAEETKIIQDEGLSIPPDIIKHVNSQSSAVQISASAIPEILSPSADAKSIKRMTIKRKSRLCCLSFSPAR